MKMGWMVAVGSACLLAPALASAQNPQGNAQPPSPTAADSGRTEKQAGRRAKVRPDSTGEAAGPTNAASASRAAMGNPKMIGSPAWWSTHATADGKPKKAESKNETPKRNP